MITPMTYNSPTPAGYAWEATTEEVAARYGVPVERVLRYDLNTSPHPPALVSEVLAGGRFETPLSEYPPSDYRRLVEAAAERYGVATDELLVGAGADEILDLIAKAFIPHGGVAVIPTPSYAMYKVLTEQRGASVADVPRRPGEEGFRLDPAGVRAAARDARLVWLCSPNNPTGLPEPEGVIADLVEGIAADAAAAGREAPAIVLDEAYAEFVGYSLADLRFRYPRLVSVRTASKAYALAGLRVGFAVALPETIARIAPYRPPGSVSTVSVTVVTAALNAPHAFRENVERVARERDRFAAGLRDVGWTVWPSVTNFLLAGLGSRERAALVGEGLLRRGLVPRTFGSTHPLADHLRLTIRDAEDNDRFVEAAREIEAELAP